MRRGAVADVGLKIAVEAFAWSAINSVPTACDLLARVDAPNAGHLLDVWHFYNTGSTTESITDLDVTTVAAVQLNDGPRVHDNFLWNARNTRLLPGEGDLDVRGFVTTLKSIGSTARSASNRAIPNSGNSMSAKQPPGRSTQR